MEKGDQEKGRVLLTYGKAIGTGGIVALGTSMAVLILGAWALCGGMFSMEHLGLITLVGCGIGCFVGGRWALSQIWGRRFVVGVCVGIVHMMLCAIIGMLFFDGQLSSGGLGLFAASLGGGMISTFLRGKKKGKGKKKRRK